MTRRKGDAVDAVSTTPTTTAPAVTTTPVTAGQTTVATETTTTATTVATTDATNTNNHNMTLRSGRAVGNEPDSEDEQPPVPHPAGPAVSGPGTATTPPTPDRPLQELEKAVLLDVSTQSGPPLAAHLFNQATIRALTREWARSVPTSVRVLGLSGALLRFPTGAAAALARAEFSRQASWMGVAVKIGAMLLTLEEADMLCTPRPPPEFDPAVPPPVTPQRGQCPPPPAPVPAGRAIPPSTTQDQNRGQGRDEGAASVSSAAMDLMERMMEPEQALEPKSSATLADAPLEWAASNMPSLRKRPREFGTSKAKPVGRPDTFRGEEAPDKQSYADWRFAIESLTSGHTMEVVRQTILATVAGTPLSILRRMGERATVSEMLEALDVAYGQVSSHDALIQRLYSIKQDRGETVTAYNARINLAVDAIETQYPHLMEPEKAILTARERFFNGLRPDLRNALRVKYEDNKQTYQQLLRSARAIEFEQRTTESSRGDPHYRTDKPTWRGSAKAAVTEPPPSPTQGGGDRESAPETLATKMANLESRLSRFERYEKGPSRGVSRERSRSTGPVDRARRDRIIAATDGKGCYRCGKTGHFVGECGETTDFEGKALPLRSEKAEAGRGKGDPSPAKPATA